MVNNKSLKMALCIMLSFNSFTFSALVKKSVPLTRDMILESTDQNRLYNTGTDNRLLSTFCTLVKKNGDILPANVVHVNNSATRLVAINENGFTVLQGGIEYPVENADVDPLIRNQPKDKVIQAIKENKISIDVNQFENQEKPEFSIRAHGNVNGGGPICAAVAYWSVKAISWGVMWGIGSNAIRIARHSDNRQHPYGDWAHDRVVGAVESYSGGVGYWATSTDSLLRTLPNETTNMAGGAVMAVGAGATEIGGIAGVIETVAMAAYTAGMAPTLP